MITNNIINCKATEESEERKIYCVAVLSSKLQLKKEVNWPGVLVKLMFFSSLETSTVTFRTVLEELLCFLSCPEFDIPPIFFFLESFFFAFFFAFW